MKYRPPNGLGNAWTGPLLALNITRTGAGKWDREFSQAISLGAAWDNNYRNRAMSRLNARNFSGADDDLAVPSRNATEKRFWQETVDFMAEYYGDVRAPVDGVAVNMHLQQGEQVKAATPLFALVSASRPWVEANFKETELTHVRVGQKATVTLDIYPDTTWDAIVESLSPATGAEFALLPPQNASGNWVKVVQRLPVKLQLLPHAGEPPLRAGMTASVRIDTNRERSLNSVFQQVVGSRPADAAATER